MSSEITVDQVVAEIARLSASIPESDGGMTSIEIRKSQQLSDNKARILIRAAIDSGALVCRRSMRRNIVGDLQSVPVYFPVKKIDLRTAKKPK